MAKNCENCRYEYEHDGIHYYAHCCCCVHDFKAKEPPESEFQKAFREHLVKHSGCTWSDATWDTIENTCSMSLPAARALWSRREELDKRVLVCPSNDALACCGRRISKLDA